MIVGVTVCPAAPWLIDAVAPALAGDPRVSAAAIREAATEIRSECDRMVAIVPGAPGDAGGGVPVLPDVLGPSPHERSSGAPGAEPPSLPAAVWVARALLGAGPLAAIVVPSDGAAAALSGLGADLDRWGVLALADGARCHGDDAPAARDDRAAAFEQRLDEVLATGDPAALADWATIEGDLAGQLGASAGVVLGAVARPLARAHSSTFTAAARYLGAPFGVGYHLASWRR